MPTFPADYAGRRVTVMGLGRFGGGVGVARFLAERGAHVLVTDTAPAEQLTDSLAKLADLEAGGAVRYRLGEHRAEDFTGCDLLVVNPAVRPDNAFVASAREADKPITSEIRLLVRHLPNRLKTIGITGTAGKSTTTAMTAHILRKVLGQAGETPYDGQTQRQIEGPGVWMGGNIGGSLLPTVDLIRDDDWVVLELSSFMLEGLREDRWSPHIAVITNISPNHLDWHGTMENYIAAKQAILSFQRHTENDAAVAGPVVHDLVEPRVLRWADFGGAGDRWWLDEPDVVPGLPGRHNQINARLAAHAVDYALLPDDRESRLPDWWSALHDFPGLPHRLEAVGEINDVRVYNDSKSTTPEAARLAVEAFDMGQVRLILGGYDKGSDFTDLAEFVAMKGATAYTLGATGGAIADLVEAAGGRAIPCETLDRAVPMALADASPGEVLLLSPGCASWDQFANYEERGERFVELVKQHAAVYQKKPTD
ncbi:MAG: UDP-N-acetylmuramoyl-L-alanine--D-glutamate ligase [Planctomycetota bacterium]